MWVEKIIKYSLFLRQCKVYQPARSQRKKGAKKKKKKKSPGVSNPFVSLFGTKILKNSFRKNDHVPDALHEGMESFFSFLFLFPDIINQKNALYWLQKMEGGRGRNLLQRLIKIWHLSSLVDKVVAEGNCNKEIDS